MHLAPIIYTFVTSYLSFDMVVLIRLPKLHHIFIFSSLCTQKINNRSNNDPIMFYRVFFSMATFFCLTILFLFLGQVIFICVGLEKRNWSLFLQMCHTVMCIRENGFMTHNMSATWPWKLKRQTPKKKHVWSTFMCSCGILFFLFWRYDMITLVLTVFFI